VPQDIWDVTGKSTANEGYFDSRKEPVIKPSPQSDDGHNDKEIPDWQFVAGLVIFAATNVGFMKLFEICSVITDIRVVLTWMAIYYAIALFLRVILRKVIGLGPWFPQFFWEGVPTRKSPR
jgi:hypothetical protein